MKPVDYRNETWSDIQGRLIDDRMEAYMGLIRHGPCTTRVLAERMGWDILRLRPRVTDLFQIGFAELADQERRREGIYQAVPMAIAQQRFEERKRDPEQMMLC